MKKTYELVCVIDAGVAGKDIDTIKKTITSTPMTVVDTDDMWLLPVAYPLRGHDQAYFISYHVQVDPAAMDEIKTVLKLERGIVKWVFYTMKETDTFLQYADLQKSYTALVEQEETLKTDRSTAAAEESAAEDEDATTATEETVDA